MQEMHHPADPEQGNDEIGETSQAIAQALVVGLLRHDTQHRRCNQRKQQSKLQNGDKLIFIGV